VPVQELSNDVPVAEAVAEDVRTAAGRVVRRLRRESGMPNQHISALGWLRRAPGPMTTSALAAVEQIRPQSMAATLGVLYAQGYIQRAADPSDGRQVLWSLTAEGRDLLDRDRRRRARWLVRAIEEELTAEETALLSDAARLLNEIMNRIEDRDR
jgi:DNA-binding MarR family transcriptional regulator